MTSHDFTPGTFDDEPQEGRDPAEESSLESAVDEGDDLEDGTEDPRQAAGSAGPLGTGVEGADDALEDDRLHDGEDGLDAFGTLEDGQGVDDSPAAEQGNRDGDEMVAEGEDGDEVSQLDGDDEDVDVIGDPLEDANAAVATDGMDDPDVAGGITGDLDGEDPLAGGPAV